MAKMTPSRKLNFSNARKRGRHTKLEWLRMISFFQKRCVSCGKKCRITKDHIIPINKGGSDSIDNIQPLCKKCNKKKRELIIDYRLQFCEKRGKILPDKYILKYENFVKKVW